VRGGGALEVVGAGCTPICAPLRLITGDVED
jgi:hypothetical protein